MRLVALLLVGSELCLVKMASAAVPAAPAPATREAPDPALVRLRELFTSSDGRLRAPKSPRFASLTEPALGGTRVVVGWLLPELSAADAAQAAALADALGRNNDGRLQAEQPALGGALTTTAVLDEAGNAKLLVLSVTSTRRGVEKELELGVLATLARLAADAGAPFSGLVRRELSPLARVVVEVHAPEARVAASPSKPLRHVIERGDTLTEIARSHGLELETLVRLNDLDPKQPIHPGEELKLAPGSALPKLYVAAAGDTLAKVARHFRISEKALADANRIELGRPLSPGQKLVLPR